jgi:hypothetical protein
MARVLLISTRRGHDPVRNDHACILRSAAIDTFKAHAITDDPDAADVILFVDPDDPYLASDVTSHPYVARYRDKCFVFDASDRVVPFLPGVYASIRRGQYDPARVRSGFFPSVGEYDWIRADAAASQRWLFSCLADLQANPVRRAVGRLRHPRALIKDTTADPGNVDGHPRDFYDRFHREYAEALTCSLFVLCPRGVGASTMRLFETMKAGRVPVVISDDWVAPDGPDWASCSLRVAERDVPHVAGILERHEAAAITMGRQARAVYESWFSEAAAFHRIVEWCLAIRRSRRYSERLMQRLVLWQLLRPFEFRHKVVPAMRGAYLP